MRFDSDLLNWTNYVKLFDLQNSQVLNNDEPVAINILPEEIYRIMRFLTTMGERR